MTITAVDNVLDTADKTVAVKGSATNTLGIIAPADRALTLVDDDGIEPTNNSASTGGVAVGGRKFTRRVRRRHHDHGDGGAERRHALKRHASDGERGRGRQHGDFGHRLRHGQRLHDHDCRRHPVADSHFHPGSDR